MTVQTHSGNYKSPAGEYNSSQQSSVVADATDSAVLMQQVIKRGACTTF